MMAGVDGSDEGYVSVSEQGRAEREDSEYAAMEDARREREDERLWEHRPLAWRPALLPCTVCGTLRKIGRYNPSKDRGMCLSCASKAKATLMVDTPCEVCGKIIHHSRNRPRRTCSMDCYRKSTIPHEKRIRGQKRRAKANPNYQHGNRVGENIRGWSPADKGETFCRKCGSTGVLNLHHIVPRSKHRAARRDLRNGMTLCVGCHHRWHRGFREITRDLIRPDELAYLVTLQLTGENIEAWLDDHYPEVYP